MSLFWKIYAVLGLVATLATLIYINPPYRVKWRESDSAMKECHRINLWSGRITWHSE